MVAPWYNGIYKGVVIWISIPGQGFYWGKPVWTN